MKWAPLSGTVDLDWLLKICQIHPFEAKDSARSTLKEAPPPLGFYLHVNFTWSKGFSILRVTWVPTNMPRWTTHPWIFCQVFDALGTDDVILGKAHLYILH